MYIYKIVRTWSVYARSASRNVNIRTLPGIAANKNAPGWTRSPYVLWRASILSCQTIWLCCSMQPSMVVYLVQCVANGYRYGCYASPECVYSYHHHCCAVLCMPLVNHLSCSCCACMFFPKYGSRTAESSPSFAATVVELLCDDPRTSDWIAVARYVCIPQLMRATHKFTAYFQ